MKISLIAAHDPGLVIGKDGSLPWYIPEDLAHFKRRTKGHPVVMGRGVFEELKERPLPGRRNIVMSRTRSYENVETYRNRKEVLEALKEVPLVYIIGGEQVYRDFYPVCDRLEITEIHEKYDGDTFFPEYRDEIGIIWKEVRRVDHENISFVDYEKVNSKNHSSAKAGI
ncbi:dihydrofolate reductase [Natronogracilivirga saccharolytica]|uniref:Dihydrofolate reductase n=1 Tax=Natronogracilivirga saccharolytica TaxID=2812953 RepID=A0A8J7S8W2_9BACT|nr:dihydrofolate reductase [Natronogracilivirga saccharolytica]MBP3192473.1 dihydrofolate reductase [Natronogracilivirga saccharolytica]